jgi:hypothetical protein
VCISYHLGQGEVHKGAVKIPITFLKPSSLKAPISRRGASQLIGTRHCLSSVSQDDIVHRPQLQLSRRFGWSASVVHLQAQEIGLQEGEVSTVSSSNPSKTSWRRAEGLGVQYAEQEHSLEQSKPRRCVEGPEIAWYSAPSCTRRRKSDLELANSGVLRLAEIWPEETGFRARSFERL